MDEQQRFREVVLPHLDDALSLARWLTGNLADADDVVQEACLRAYGAIRTVRRDNPRAWLLVIVRNTAFTWLAKNRPKAVVVTDDERIFEQASLEMIDRADMITPEAAIIARADADQLQRAITALPLSFREVLVLREIEGLSYREIAEIVSIPVGTVMSRLARARSLLIQRIGIAGAGKAGAA
ncbi:MAG: sigma-70 family RNA polymerase sigma factor [Rhodomicrobiaceae bacterium]